MTRAEAIHSRFPRIEASDLIEPTGDDRIDDFLFCLANTLGIAVGDSLRAFFVIGSYAHGGVAPDSDIDCCLVWKDGADEECSRTGLGIVAHLSRLMEYNLDPMYNYVERPFYDPADFAELYDSLRCGPVLKLAVKEHSKLLWGEDIRPRIVSSRPEDMLQHVLESPFCWIKQAHCRPTDGSHPLECKIVLPLTDPDPESEDRGYGGIHRVSLRILHFARAMVFLETGEFLFNKMHVPDAYDQYVGEPWAGLVRDVFELRYGDISEDERGMRSASACPRVTAFGNYFLDRLAAKGVDISQHVET